MKLTFWGAAKQVTGSMFLLELEDEFRILIECGMDMERKAPLPDFIGLFPFEPSMIHLVLLTHAHVDHSGLIPNLLREGFEGQVICTPATKDLTELLLNDSASINQKRLKKFQKKLKSQPGLKLPDSLKELYLHKQVQEALHLFRTVQYKQKIRIHPQVSVTFIQAGHLLGAAHILMQIQEDGKEKTICFSGDLGRKNYPLLQDPEPIPEVDYLICESTYGNRYHLAQNTAEEAVSQIIQETCVEVPGKLIVPAFSVGRTQAMLYTLHKLQVAGQLPPIKIFTDSPLALKSSQVYQKYLSLLNAEAREFAKTNGQLFDFENLIYLEDIKDSKMAAHYNKPCIIVSSSGMVQGGRIEYHVKENLNNKLATILMIGFSAEGTMGYDLIHSNKTIMVKNKEIPIQARVERIDNFSGHGDLNDLMDFVQYQSPQKVKKIFLVHGELDSMTDFCRILHENGYTQTEIPERGIAYDL
ncbi:MAG: MBL fold metallo-hydrolase [Microscillaceae bacterium]|nr:MBL fold metallo-hydrolase [Microscillaceae bacterium]